MTGVYLTTALCALIHMVTSTEGCGEGLYGPTCSLPCGEHCNSSVCESDTVRGTYKCSFGCEDGWSGLSCERKCPIGCESCDQITGTCAACKSGCCGKNCGPICADTSCRNCQDPSCQACLQGWYGQNCNIPCPQHCDSGCSKQSGKCNYQCDKGYHGNFCRKVCTTTCVDGCKQMEGSCIGGCDTGWHGQFCNVSCSSTCVGKTCYQVSGECIIGVTDKPERSELSRCLYMRAGGQLVKNCTSGCEAGWRGSRCDQRCPDECYSCSRYPDSQLCIYGKEVVAVHTYGSDHDESGRLEMRTVYALLLVIPPFLIVGIVQAISVCWEKYKRHKEMKKTPGAYELCEEKNITQTV